MNNTSSKFREDLQGLRAVAIWLVLMAHSGLNILPGGFIGVDVFFVISGYLITSLLYREKQQTGRISLLRFYAKRLKRLFPALLFMVVAVTVFILILLTPFESSSQLLSIPYVLTWTSNINFALTEIDYFDDLAGKDMFLHTWSLGVEEQFYLIWPFIILLLFAKNSFRMANGSLARDKLMVSFLLFAGFIIAYYWNEYSPQQAYYMMPTRIWQLAFGAAVYVFFSASGERKEIKPDYHPRLSRYVAYSGLFLVIGFAIAFNPNQYNPGLWTVIPVAGAALIIVSGNLASRSGASLLSHPLLVWFGDRSYSMYLWHWPVFVLGYLIGFEGQYLPVLAMVMLVIALSHVSYHYVELPFWKGRFSQHTPRNYILSTLCVLAIVLLAHDYGVDVMTKANSVAMAEKNAIEKLSRKWRDDMPVLYRDGCDAGFERSTPEPCVFAGDGFQKTAVFIGDSIGAQWFSFMTELYPEPEWRIIAYTKSACAMVDEDYYYPRIKKIYSSCTAWRNAALNEIQQIKPDVVVTGNSISYEFNRSQWIDGSSRVLDRLSLASEHVIVIPGTPSPGFHGPRCLARKSLFQDIRGNVSCESSNKLHMAIAVENYIQRAVDAFSNVHLLSLNDLVCPGDVCKAINEKDVVVFRDAVHLTDSYVRMLIPEIRKRVELIAKRKKTER